jgi:hypothetical protein
LEALTTDGGMITITNFWGYMLGIDPRYPKIRSRIFDNFWLNQQLGPNQIPKRWLIHANPDLSLLRASILGQGFIGFDTWATAKREALGWALNLHGNCGTWLIPVATLHDEGVTSFDPSESNFW